MLISKCIDSIDRFNTSLFLFLIICFNFLGFQISGGQEQYYTFAKQFVDPNWVKGSFSCSEASGTRIVFEWITGNMLKILSFEMTAFIQGIVVFAFFAIALSRLSKLLQIKNSILFIILQLIFIGNQCFYAGEWILGNVEPKSFSYLFILFSLYYLIENKYYKAIAFAALSSYFHIVVGGWFVLVAGTYILWNNPGIKTLSLSFFIYTLLLSPFVIYLYNTYFGGSSNIINGINLDWVYTHVRVPHHTVMFWGWSYFFKNYLWGLMLMTTYVLAINFVFKKPEFKPLIQLKTFINIVFLHQMLMIIVAWFDANGEILKYYIFRMNALMHLCILLYFAKLVTDYIINKSTIKIPILIFTLFIISTGILINNTIKNIEKSRATILFEQKSPEKAQLYNYIRINTPKESSIIVITENENNYYDFIRRTERDIFVMFKFLPAENKKLYNWYVRYMEQEKVKKDTTHVFEIAKSYNIDYMILNKPYNDLRANLAFKNHEYYLYKIDSAYRSNL